MNPNDQPDEIVEYDPGQYLRGGVNRHAGQLGDGEDLPWGKHGRHHYLDLTVHGEQGVAGFPYHAFAGKDEDEGSFTLYFGRAIIGGVEGSWRLTVEGSNLGKALDFFSMGQLQKLRVSSAGKENDPVISAIRWEAFHPEEPEEVD